MRLTGFRTNATALTRAALILGLAVASTAAIAQESNLYRAEIVLLERLVAPEAVTERMASRNPEPIPELPRKLWVVGEGGTPETTMDLVPRDRMTLSSAAARLERSGQYRVLMSAAWRQAFPPDFKGEPMQIAVGDWLEPAGEREIQGSITIERMRYLHVTARLHHWQSATAPSVMREPAGQAGMATDAEGTATAEASGSDNTPALGLGEPDLQAPLRLRPLELVTWIHETRRMRSEEIHYLDSPTIGVLVFFKRIEGGAGQGGQPSAQALP